ncbi:MAG TPA: bifunctional phosphopantothenoylcysteine decarboxylase/phosphopantothenate--cysteine ligase CoaBC [Actinomycetota bacterium]|nr:bifunctional phosphopantothenoylcysteine decarboxylase/phosphopantothenate--cysteine ligase CoaBC [Actinomycetota bacterium]
MDTGASGSPPSGLAEVVAGKKIILCVTGGIAAYKVAFVARGLAQAGADVRVVMTRSAERFVGEQTFTALTGNHVYRELFGQGPDIPHIELARGADLVVVAPATANAMAKIAGGFADDLFSATVLTARCPILLAPAMHTEMWENAATQANVAILQERGIQFVGPVEGALSSGDEGIGRMVEPDEILIECSRVVARSEELSGRKFVVTAGGTQEPIDPVRFIGNRSSGLMGMEIARAASARGAKVILVVGPTNLRPPPDVEVLRVKTAQEMRDEVFRAASDADVIVKAAAVADWQSDVHADHKLKKAKGPPDIKLVPTPDILAELGASPSARKPNGILVGFAAETEPDPGRLALVALHKKKSKGADLIVANDVSSPDSGFEVPTNRAVIAGPDGTVDVGLVTKAALAEALIDRIALLLT